EPGLPDAGEVRPVPVLRDVIPALQLRWRPQRGDHHLDVGQQEDDADQVGSHADDQQAWCQPPASALATQGKRGLCRGSGSYDSAHVTWSLQRVTFRNTRTTTITSPKLITDMAADSPMNACFNWNMNTVVVAVS